MRLKTVFYSSHGFNYLKVKIDQYVFGIRPIHVQCALLHALI